MIPTTENVLAVFARATPTQIRTGMRWYDEANEFAQSLDSNQSRAAGVIAALSPLKHWEDNKRAAQKVYANGTSLGTHFIANEVKVDAILAGADPVEIFSRGTARKVLSFYNTILNPTGYVIPTIDRHAFDIAVNERGAYIRAGDKILNRKGAYDRFGMTYIDAAKALCIGAPQVQAVTWVVWRDEKVKR